MKKVLFFAGLPGVGKSTISKQVTEKMGAKIVDLDDFKRIYVDPALVTNQIDPPEVRWNYYQKAMEYVFDLFDHGLSMVVIDEVFHLNSLRLRLEALCAKQNVQVVWVEVCCGYDVVEKRLRSKGREGHILSTDEALRIHLQFERIFEKFSIGSQNHIIANNEGDVEVDALVENILAKIT